MISPARFVQLARGALWLNVAIVVTGASVRLTGSGLGCSDWPRCEEDRFVASLEYHALIEFGNRLFTGAVGIAVILAVLGSLRRVPRRLDLIRWAAGLVAGVLAQAILGAFVVRSELAPQMTMAHFLLSMVLLWNATVLVEKAACPDTAADTAPAFMARTSFERVRSVRRTTRTAFVWCAVLLVTGTVVTGSGPHSGSDDPEVAARLPFLVRDVTRIHSVAGLLAVGLIVSIVRRAHLAGLTEVRGQAMRVSTLFVVQATVGYRQYFTGVPVLLVGVHIAIASIAWIEVVRLAWIGEHASIGEGVPT